MDRSTNEGLLHLLRAEVESAQADADAVRSSLRYRLGDTLLQALPLSYRSFRVIPSVLALLLTHRRSVRADVNAGGHNAVAVALPAAALQCSRIIFDPAADSTAETAIDEWQTSDVALLIARLDALPVKHLRLHAVVEPVARRLARLQYQGCSIECRVESADPLVRYAQALIADAPTGGAH